MSPVVVALRVCVVILAFIVYIGWSNAKVQEARRSRAATCLLLAELSADPQTAAERWPCDDFGF